MNETHERYEILLRLVDDLQPEKVSEGELRLVVTYLPEVLKTMQRAEQDD